MVFINEVGIYMFATPGSLGAMSEETQKVAGFEPHGFRVSPLKTLPSWKLKRLELIGLLKFPKPRAYVLDHLPRMDQLTHENANTRPLTKFESAALSKLKSKQDIVVEREGKSIRMVGAIRATKTCLTCHSVERGELLGAFTYDLVLNGKGF